MQNRSAYALAIVLVVLVCSAGCASFIPDITGAPKATPTKTPTKTPTVTPNFTPTMNVAATVIPLETTLVIKTPVPTPTPKPTPTGYYLIPPEITGEMTPVPTIVVESNVSQWKVYRNNDFVVEYPGGWEVVESYQPQPGKVLYPETNLIGDTRVVRFESGNGITNFTAYTTDLRAENTYDQDMTIAWSQKTITPRLPDISGTGGSMTNWEKHLTALGTEYVSFDVIVPEFSMYYPYEYTEWDLASRTHIYTFRFNTDNLTVYKNMRYHIFNSLKTQEKKFVVNGEIP
jgi:hypothetical protein